MIFVSTGGRPDKTAWETAREFAELGILGVELSGGKSSAEANKGILEAAKYAKLQPHNYFPPPIDPFVLNLASEDSIISKRSFEHIKNSIDIAALVGAKSYSFHAGYLVDPHPKELGKKVTKRILMNREEAIDRFTKRCFKLAYYAKQKGIRLLIENNVLSKKNFEEFEENPFLMVDTEECEKIMSMLGSQIGLLVDVAHLKVSARTLDFDRLEFLRKNHSWIESYHLSDNDGNKDSNSPMTTNSWFWPYLKSSVEDIVIEVYSQCNRTILDQYRLVMEAKK